MDTMASQITSLTIIYSIVYSGADQRNIKSPRHWPLWGEFSGDRWIPRTKGQLRKKGFHLMTTSWNYAHARNNVSPNDPRPRRDAGVVRTNVILGWTARKEFHIQQLQIIWLHPGRFHAVLGMNTHHYYFVTEALKHITDWNGSLMPSQLP